VSHEKFNPLCGDRIRIELKLDQTTIAEARFKGDGCAISTAAASLLTELVTGKQLDTVTAVTDDQLIALLASDIQPARRQCALLPLEALRAGLNERA
jgi:nitrogen fixation NifU-like protein